MGTRHHISTISSVNNSKEKTSTMSNNGDQATEKVLITGNITELSIGNYNNKEKTSTLSTSNGKKTLSITSNNGKEAAEPTRHKITTMSSVNNSKVKTSTVSNIGDQTTEKVFQTVDVAEISIGNYFNYEKTSTLSTSNGNNDKETILITSNNVKEAAEPTGHQITTTSSVNNSNEKTSIMSNNGNQPKENEPSTGDIAESSLGSYIINKENTSTLSSSNGDNDKEKISITYNV